MKVFINSKCQYKKADSAMKMSLLKNILKLNEKLSTLDVKDMNRLFNLDSVIYDRVNNELFVYKGRGINNQQIRIVYSVVPKDSGFEIYLIEYISKKENNKKYLRYFSEKYARAALGDFTFCEMAI